VWALPLWPQATPTSQGEERAEFGRHAFVPATGDQRNEDNDKLCQRELSAAGEVLGAFLGDRLNEVEEKYEQALIKLTFRTLCRTSEAILEEPLREGGVGAIDRPCHTL
jgi:hypothetical protein